MDDSKKDSTLKMFFDKPVPSDASVEFDKIKSTAEWMAVEMNRLGAMQHVQNVLKWVLCEKEIDKLAIFVVENFADRIGRDETAVDVAIKLLKEAYE